MKYIVFDCETTGLLAGTHQILTTSLAIYDTEQKKILDRIKCHIKHRPYIVDIEALKVNKIDLIQHDEKSQPAGYWKQILSDWVKERFPNERPQLCGYNVSFDIKFWTATFGEEFMELFHYQPLDVMSMVKHLKYSGKVQRLTLTNVYKCMPTFKQELLDGAHDCMTDVEMTCEILQWAMENAKI